MASIFANAQDRAVTDDAVAEAFAQCLRRGEEIRSPRAWVRTTAFRLAAAELMERSRHLPLADARLEPRDLDPSLGQP